MPTVTIVAISDTHGLHDQLVIPPGDILVHAGDLTRSGYLEEVALFDRFLATLPHPTKVIVAGNHDFCFQDAPDESRQLLRHAHYLQDEAVSLCGLRFYGSPWQPWFFDWAFNLPRGESLRRKWDLIADGVDVLVTHAPPAGMLDVTANGEHAGCADLRRAVRRVRPSLHIFGHIHECAGTHDEDGTTFVNACSLAAGYRPTIPPVVVEVEV